MIHRLLPRFASVGATTTDLGAGTLTHRPGLADEPTATFLHAVRPDDRAALDDLLDRAAAVVGTPVRRVMVDGATPSWVEAELVVRDWTLEAIPHLVLPAATALPPPRNDAARSVRPAVDADWPALGALYRADHEEEDRKAGRPPRPVERTERVVAARRGLPPPVRYFVAERDDGVVGFLAGWPGDDDGGGDGRLGLLEDLFVAPGHRGSGLAVALLCAALDHARAGGAGPVAIGADADDTPKHLYARLGFVPAALLRVLHRA